eukprot:1176159-Prorocentrum_minimum.AAC.3
MPSGIGLDESAWMRKHVMPSGIGLDESAWMRKFTLVRDALVPFRPGGLSWVTPRWAAWACSRGWPRGH